MKNIIFVLAYVTQFFVLGQQPILLNSVNTGDHSVFSMDVTPDGKWLATGGSDFKIQLWSTDNYQGLFSLSGHTDWVTAVAFSDFTPGKRKFLASGSKNGHLAIHDFDTKQIYFQGQVHDKTIYDLLFIDQFDLLIAVSSDGQISFFDLNSKQWQKAPASDDVVFSLTYYPDKNQVVTTDAKGVLKFWNPASKLPERVVNDRDDYVRGAVIFDGKIITVGDDKAIIIRDIESGSEQKQLDKAHKKWIDRVVEMGDNLHFATGGQDGMVSIWNAETGTNVASVKQNGDFVSGIAFSTDLKKMFSIGHGGALNIWDVSGMGFEPIKPVVDPQASLASRSQDRKSVDNDLPDGIHLVQPFIRGKQTFYCLEEEIVIKGTAKVNLGIREFKITNLASKEVDRVSIGKNGYFEQSMRLGYLDNKIVLSMTGSDGSTYEETINVHRIFDQNNPEELVKLSRNGRDYALIIATNDYSAMSQLTNPIFDATTIANELETSYGFEVEKVFNPTLEEIKLKIKDYAKRLYASEDQLFIFIAGHGEYDELYKEGYIVATDSKQNDEARTSYLPHSTLRTIVNSIPCEHIFLVMDVCFGGTFDPVIAKRGNESIEERARRMQIIKRKLKYKSRYYMTSGGKEYVPDGRPGMHSPFARNFIKSLRTYGGSDRILTTKDIYADVEMVTPEPRFGEFGDNEPGSDFIFIHN